MEHDENLDNISTPQQRKRPNLLMVLLILSGFYIATNTYGIIQDFMRGPISQEQVDEQLLPIYNSINDLQSQGASPNVIGSLKTMVANTKYINNDAFYLYNSLTLFTLLFGAVSLFFMFKLKKIGFHLYIIYSLLPIISMYIIFPINKVSTLSIVFSLFVAALFSLLYGKNLKFMK